LGNEKTDQVLGFKADLVASVKTASAMPLIGHLINIGFVHLDWRTAVFLLIVEADVLKIKTLGIKTRSLSKNVSHHKTQEVNLNGQNNYGLEAEADISALLGTSDGMGNPLKTSEKLLLKFKKSSPMAVHFFISSF
jgi:hypothetical protein